MKSFIKLDNLTKRVGTRTIVKNLNLELDRGEVLGFLGPNGAGKTTTMRMMVGLIKPTNGEVYINGDSLREHKVKSLKRVGAIIENPAFYNYMSGWNNLKYFSSLQGKIKKEKLTEIVEVVGLSDRINEKVRTYSLGMKQRLGLAQCLVHDPNVLILDEPTNGLDPSGIKEFREYIRSLAKEKNIAIMVSSHQISEMEQMCDRIAIIQKGELVIVQNVHELKNKQEKDFIIELDNVNKAKKLIQETFSLSIYVEQNKLIVKASRQDISEISKVLLGNNINIYSFTEMTKNLEDYFMEITKNSEGVKREHA